MSDLPLLRDKVVAIVKDESGKLVNPDDFDQGIAAALLKYSKDKPFQVIEDIDGDGSTTLIFPNSWSPEFSSVIIIEYPIGDMPPTLLEAEEYLVISRSGTLRLASALAIGQRLRVTFTTVRTADDIADIDVQAVANLSASFCLETLANAFLQLGDSLISADAVNYRTKSQEAASRAKRLMQLYGEQMGIQQGDSGAGSTPAALAVADYDEKYPGGAERLTHPRWARRKR